MFSNGWQLPLGAFYDKIMPEGIINYYNSRRAHFFIYEVVDERYGRLKFHLNRVSQSGPKNEVVYVSFFIATVVVA